MEKPEYPSEALIASIQHQAEKLGYLVAQVERIFDNHAKYDRHIATYTHSVQGSVDLKAWMAGEITDEELAERSAHALEETAKALDAVKANHQHNTNTLNQIVQDGIRNGGLQAHDLDNILSEILGQEQ